LGSGFAVFEVLDLEPDCVAEALVPAELGKIDSAFLHVHYFSYKLQVVPSLNAFLLFTRLKLTHFGFL